MYILDAVRSGELHAIAAASPINFGAVSDAVVMGGPLPKDLTLERLAIEYILLKWSLSAADFSLATHHEFWH